MSVSLTPEPEITRPVDLCLPDGHLDRSSVGWTRHPLHTANLRGWGRTKRWEYWCVQGPDHVLALTVSSIDYLALHTVWFMSYDGLEVDRTVIQPFSRVSLPRSSGAGDLGVRARHLQIRVQPTAGGVRLRALTDRVSADISLERPAGHESLGVVIPWSDSLFQYTVKENTLPATGAVTVDGRTFDFEPEDSFGVLDHGRGRWPYRTTWNWGSGSGTSAGTTVGLQLGGKWTDGTGMTENALCLDGRLHKIGADLDWQYDTADWLRPWTVRDARDGRVDLRFTPRFERRARTQALAVATEVHQCFGTWDGDVVADDGTVVPVRSVRGFAEEARMRW